MSKASYFLLYPDGRMSKPMSRYRDLPGWRGVGRAPHTSIGDAVIVHDTGDRTVLVGAHKGIVRGEYHTDPSCDRLATMEHAAHVPLPLATSAGLAPCPGCVRTKPRNTEKALRLLDEIVAGQKRHVSKKAAPPAPAPTPKGEGPLLPIDVPCPIHRKEAGQPCPHSGMFGACVAREERFRASLGIKRTKSPPTPAPNHSPVDHKHEPKLDRSFLVEPA